MVVATCILMPLQIHWYVSTCGCGYMHTYALQMLLIEAHVQLLLLPKQSFVVFEVAGFQEI